MLPLGGPNVYGTSEFWQQLKAICMTLSTLRSSLKSNLPILVLLPTLELCTAVAQHGAFSKAKHIGHPAPNRYHVHERPASLLYTAARPVPKPLSERIILNGFSLEDSYVFQFLQPVYLAARGLARFCGEILNYAIHEWSSLLPQITGDFVSRLSAGHGCHRIGRYVADLCGAVCLYDDGHDEYGFHEYISDNLNGMARKAR